MGLLKWWRRQKQDAYNANIQARAIRLSGLLGVEFCERYPATFSLFVVRPDPVLAEIHAGLVIAVRAFDRTGLDSRPYFMGLMVTKQSAPLEAAEELVDMHLQDLRRMLLLLEQF